MKPVIVVAVLLIALGLAALPYDTIYTRPDTVMHVQKTIWLVPLMVMVVVGTGIVLLRTGMRQRA